VSPEEARLRLRGTVGRGLQRLGWPGRAIPDGTLFDVGLLRTRPAAEIEAAVRRRCCTVPVSADTALCRALGRYKMYVDLADEGLSPHLMLDGVWELGTTRALACRVGEGVTAFDVGANLGYYTLLLAELVGAAGHVHAAEPNPHVMSRLHRSVRLNGFAARVSLHAAPLGAAGGEEVVLHVPEGLPQNASLRGGGREGAVRHVLRTTTLDEIVGDGPVGFVKIDAEGAEQAIWQGMARLLARRERLTVFVEFTPDRYEDPAAFLRQMLATGFALSIVDADGTVRPVGFDAVLAGPRHEDRMLVLER
jgi:FkbM family methyltransferase